MKGRHFGGRNAAPMVVAANMPKRETSLAVAVPAAAVAGGVITGRKQSLAGEESGRDGSDGKLQVTRGR